MSAARRAQIDERMRATFAALADVLIPEAAGMPAASQVDVQGKWLDRVLQARPDILEPLTRILTQAGDQEPSDHVRRLQQEDPVGFGALALAASGGYYMNPKIRKLIGYPGQKANPPYPDEAEYYLRDGLLDPVIARGPIYRPAP